MYIPSSIAGYTHLLAQTVTKIRRLPITRFGACKAAAAVYVLPSLLGVLFLSTSTMLVGRGWFRITTTETKTTSCLQLKPLAVYVPA